MNKRIIAVVGAALLALIGIVMLISYTQNANDRAFDGAELKSVLQVTETIPADTKASEGSGSVELVELPKKAIAKDAVTDLSEVSGLSTTVALEPGEQLLLTRFSQEGSPKADSGPSAVSVVPKGYQEVTVPLDVARAAGGVLRPGDLVGVVASYQTNDTGGFTQLAKNFVRVTRVSGGLTGGKDDGATGQLVTLAVTTRNAGRIINAAEFGKLWLTKQNKDTATGSGGSVTKSEITK